MNRLRVRRSRLGGAVMAIVLVLFGSNVLAREEAKDEKYAYKESIESSGSPE